MPTATASRRGVRNSSLRIALLGALILAPTLGVAPAFAEPGEVPATTRPVPAGAGADGPEPTVPTVPAAPVTTPPGVPDTSATPPGVPDTSAPTAPATFPEPPRTCPGGVVVAQGAPCPGLPQGPFGPDGYDHFGYDSSGFDRTGYDRTGYDRFGFDRFGFDRAGFDHAGFDTWGRDRSGFDRFGFDRWGHDREGYTRAGCRADGKDREWADRAACDEWRQRPATGSAG